MTSTVPWNKQGQLVLERRNCEKRRNSPTFGNLFERFAKDFETENAGTPNASIRVQAGDMVGTSPANSALLQDEPTVKVFNEMNFEYGTL